jgi:hypothetical protein
MKLQTEYFLNTISQRLIKYLSHKKGYDSVEKITEQLCAKVNYLDICPHANKILALLPLSHPEIIQVNPTFTGLANTHKSNIEFYLTHNENLKVDIPSFASFKTSRVHRVNSLPDLEKLPFKSQDSCVWIPLSERDLLLEREFFSESTLNEFSGYARPMRYRHLSLEPTASDKDSYIENSQYILVNHVQFIRLYLSGCRSLIDDCDRLLNTKKEQGPTQIRDKVRVKDKISTPKSPLPSLELSLNLSVRWFTPQGPKDFVKTNHGPDTDISTLNIPLEAIRVGSQRAIAFRRLNGKISISTFDYELKPHEIKSHMLTAYLNRGGGGNPVMTAISESLNCQTLYAEDFHLFRSGVPIVWGVLRNSKTVIDSAIKHNQYFYYVDHAYFARGHNQNYRISRNGFEAGPVKVCPQDRFDSLGIQMKDWNKSGKKIIVCPPTEYFQNAHNCRSWLDDTLRMIKRYTDRKIVIRDKPKSGDAIVPLEQQLKEAHALVTHSSNVAIESVVLGTPVFVSPTSAAAPVGETDLRFIETPKYPDRQPWLNHLAYCQFSMSEIQSGRFFDILLDFENKVFL